MQAEVEPSCPLTCGCLRKAGTWPAGSFVSKGKMLPPSLHDVWDRVLSNVKEVIPAGKEARHDFYFQSILFK